jgi:hypothetical protein
LDEASTRGLPGDIYVQSQLSEALITSSPRFQPAEARPKYEDTFPFAKTAPSFSFDACVCSPSLRMRQRRFGLTAKVYNDNLEKSRKWN